MGKTAIQWTAGDDGSQGETWNPIPSWPQFEITTSGVIRRGSTKRVLKPMTARRGHLYIIPVRGKKLYIHQAVLETFVGPRPAGYVTRHLDGNPTNNHLSNLVWGTYSENMQDRRGHGDMVRPEQVSPLTSAQVAEIKRLLPSMTRRALGARFGVSHTTINMIAQGKRWKEVAA